MEAMAVEALVASAWQLDGFLSKVRWPLKVSGGYTDIDVVGVNAEGHVRLAECKVRGTAQQVYVVDDDGAAEFETWLGTWAKCLDNIERLWADRPPWLPPASAVSAFEFWFCGNLWLAPTAREDASQRFQALVAKRCPWGFKGKTSVRIVSTFEIITEVTRKVRERVLDEGHGKRFGDPLLDALREITRYLHPAPTGGGRVGGAIAQEAREQLLAAFDISKDNDSG